MRNPYDLIGRLGLLLAIAARQLAAGRTVRVESRPVAVHEAGTQTVDNLVERIVDIVVGVGGVLALPMLAASLARSQAAT